MSEEKIESIQEYMMLREEIIHLDSIINNTIGFFYAFMSAYLVVILESTKNKPFYLNLSYLIVWATYAIVLSKMQGLCKIGAYLKVYHEGKGKIFNWETRNLQFEKKNRSLIFRLIISGNFPFVFMSTVIALISVYLTISEYADVKYFFVTLILYSLTLCLIIFNRNIRTKDYICDWDEVKSFDEM